MICDILYCSAGPKERGHTNRFGVLCDKHHELWNQELEKANIDRLAHASVFRRLYAKYKMNEEAKALESLPQQSQW